MYKKPWLLMLLGVTLIFACQKESLIVDKDSSKSILEVNRVQTELANLEVSDIYNSEKGWIVCSNNSTSYFKMLDSTGKLIGEKSSAYIPSGKNPDRMVSDTGNLFYRYVLDPSDKSKVMLQRLDQDLNVLKEWLAYDAPDKVELSGIAFDQSSRFAFSIYHYSNQSQPSVLVYDWYEEKLEVLASNRMGTELLGFHRFSNGRCSMFLYHYVSGIAANMLSLEKNNQVISNHSVPDCRATNRRSKVAENYGPFFFYPSETGLSMIEVGEWGYVAKGPVQLNNMQVYDIVWHKYSMYVLYSEAYTYSTGNLLLGKVNLHGVLRESKTLDNTVGAKGKIKLRFNDDESWSLIGRFSNDVLAPLEIVTPN